jgi:hypothetical protein
VAASIMAAAPRTARAGLSKRTKKPSPVVFASRPAKRSISVRTPVVLGQQQPPTGVTEFGQHLGGTGQVGEDQGREDAVGDLIRRLREKPATSPVNGDPRLIPDDPRVVTGRDLEGIPAHDLQRSAVGHFDVQMPGHDVADVVHLAALGANYRLDVLGPAPAWLEYGPSYGQLS